MSNGNNSLPRSALSPVSVASSEWSGISKYQSITGEQLYGGGGGGGAPETPGGGGGGTPPRKGSLGGLNGMNGSGPPGGRGGGGPNGSGPNNSPPPSVTRSSDGTGLYPQNDSSLQDIILEEQVATHHSALKKLLQPYLVQQGGVRPNRAKDKLLRLSIIQFQELSTDVYDELQRRIAAGDRLYSPGGHAQDVRSGYLLPKDTFHPKRNQARQKLSTLPKPRFRDLATDVFYELERRYPKFSGVDLDGVSSPTGSIAGSIRGIPPPGRVGSPGPGMGPPRVGSPGPGGGGPPRAGSPGPNGTRNGPGYGLGIGSPPNGAPRLGNPTPGSHPRNMPGLGIPGMGPNGPPPGAPGGPDEFGRPMPKQFQSNTIIPNKSTMVEEDDDDGPGDDDDDEDAFGLEDPNRKSNGPGKRSTGGGLVNGGPQARRDSSRSVRSVRNGQNGTPSGSGEADKKLIAEYQNKIEILLDKVSGLESSLGEKDEEIRALRAGGGNPESNMMQQERKEWQEIRLGLEAKLEDAQNLNQSLQTEIAKVQADNAASERSLQQQLVELQDRSMNGGNGIGGTGDLGYNELLRQHEELKKDLQEQEEVTEEVRREAMEFLNQMKSLSEHTDNSWEREEKLSLEVQKLQEEVKEWKLRYARTKSTLRNLRASSMGLSLQSPTMLIGKEGGLVDPNGIVKDVNVTKFQISIDELLRVARSVNFANTLESVKAVVVATRAVTQDINESVSHNDDRVKLKSRVSATANNLITAAKNHSTGGGLSPVSLVDAAASHLTASIVELIKLVKICPTPVGELQEYDEDLIISPESPRNFPIPPGMGGTVMGGTTTSSRPSAISEAPRLNGERSSNNSVYSPLNSPRHSQNRPRNDSNIPSWSRPSTGTGRGPAFGIRTNENNVEELRVFLETQTQGVVEAIQTLLQAIRGDGELNDFRAHVGDIATVVGKVIASTETAMSQTGNNALRDKGDWIVSNLSQCRTKMLDMTEEDEPDDGPSIKEYKSRLAGLAFEMAKQTRALVGVVEEIDNEARGVVMDDDHFR